MDGAISWFWQLAHIKKNNKTHDRSNKNLKKWYCPLLQKGYEGQPSEDVEKTLLNQIESCKYLANPREKNQNTKYPDPITYHGLVINVFYFCINHHKESWL